MKNNPKFKILRINVANLPNHSCLLDIAVRITLYAVDSPTLSDTHRHDMSYSATGLMGEFPLQHFTELVKHE